MKTLHRGLIEIRNRSLPRVSDPIVVNSLAEALHELPAMLSGLEYFKGGEEEMVEIVRLHLKGFDERAFPGTPNLLEIFDGVLAVNPDGA